MPGNEADQHGDGGPDRREGGNPRRRRRAAPPRRGGAAITRVTLRLTTETAKRLAVGAELADVDKSDLAEVYLAAGLQWVTLQRQHVPERVPKLRDRGGREKEAADPDGGAAEEV
jgi:hypothetical protein